jgi:NAD(P)-dependent dehydrogenase (short-subunit alcohol dehydrogenase family)
VKAALITGATGGIGRATVRRLDELGWRVFAGARNLESAEELAGDCRRVTPIELDITDERAIARACDQVARDVAGRGLDALVNNAGIVIQGPLELVPLKGLRRQFEVNVFGMVAVTQAFLPLLRIARGRVVNISGAAARTALPFLGPISASKAALESLSDALRVELKHQRIPVSIVVPGLLSTELHDKAAKGSRRDGYAGTPDVQEIYADVLAVPEQIIGDSKLAPVESAVTKIVKALMTAHPATRYVAGRDARQLGMLRFVPGRLRDRLLIWNFKLNAERFRSPQPDPHRPLP